jgi:hypothetical protein
LAGKILPGLTAAGSVRGYDSPANGTDQPYQETGGVAVDAKAIATYTERLLEVRREFALYRDRVVVQAQWRLKGKFTHVVKLAALDGEVQELTIRYRMYRYAGWVLMAGALVFALSYYYAEGRPPGTVGHIAIGVMILGATVRALTFLNRRVRFARFNSKSGHAGLDIGSAGNDIAVFEEFVKQVRRQIAKA